MRVVAFDVTDVACGDVVGPIGVVHFASGIDRIGQIETCRYSEAAGRIRNIYEAANAVNIVVSLLHSECKSEKSVES